ncbi:MAG TPA: UvrD-helicase domain-containing protein [Solirubrobacteraceae bacterium]|nr:UvrD-helicase domain-containing protein [Solirubrobacteraceae bacterium]
MAEAPAMNGFTSEQREAIRRREGDLFLDAGAGSGKTSVLVERFARGVVEDGLDPAAILTITFTEKAAAEMRERIRLRLRELGAPEAARATEGAFISTIHGFCARVLRTHALAVGIDPAFAVLDELEAGRLADGAFEAALIHVAEDVPGALELIAGYGRFGLRGAIQAIHDELRSRGERPPRLPALPRGPALEPLRERWQDVADRLLGELREVPEPSPRVIQAVERLARVSGIAEEPWPGDLDALRLPGGNGAALSTEACAAYSEALAELRRASAHRWAERAYPLLERLLAEFTARYERAKHEHAGLDFEDLELLCRDLLRDNDELRERYRQRFERVMVDELQDTNAVQLELIDMVAAGKLFTVGDAQQSIYGFRHADVELFEARGEVMAARGARLTLRTNFRSRPEILAVINRVFERELGDRFRPLVAGREEQLDPEPRVELLVTDREADWTAEGLAAAWRVAEARALAGRVAELLSDGVPASDVVVLTRATTDLRVYERALEERGVPTYLIGGRGYWSHPQIVDLLAYLRVLANPRDEEALYTLLASPLVGVSTDGLVLLAAVGRESARDPWWVLRDPEDRLDPVPADRDRMVGFAAWAAGERVVAARAGVEGLIERVLDHTGYDLHVLALPGGQRRLANVRKLMRLGRHHAAAHGPDLRSFLELVALRSSAWIPDPDQSEAPVESEGLDAVRLMTIHRAKGLEFPVVCVADLGRAPRWSAPLLRVGRDGRVGLRLARPGTGRKEPALAYDALADEERSEAAAEERRLFYVAMTRAQERLILSGAARLEKWGQGPNGVPMAWLGPALVGDLSAGEGVSEGVRFSVVRPAEADLDDIGGRIGPQSRPGQGLAPPPALPSQPEAPPVGAVSYTSLAAYRRCGYRFYVERVLGIPPTEGRAGADAPPGEAVLDAAERGTLVHALLENIDFRRPVPPSPAAIIAAAPREPTPAEVEDVTGLLQAFAGSELRERLWRASRVRREQRFGFLHRQLLISGMLDVMASEPGNRTLIVDYKSDRLAGADPASLVAGEYGTQQLIYALAALRAGAAEVEVVHVFLERPEEPIVASFGAAQSEELEARLDELTQGLLARRFQVTESPQRGVCHGCPAEGGLCSWPLEMTRRGAADTLF